MINNGYGNSYMRSNYGNRDNNNRDSSSHAKRTKNNSMFDRLQLLRKENTFTARPDDQGHGSFFTNTKKTENMIKIAGALQAKAELTRSVDAFKYFLEAYIKLINVFVIDKKFSNSLFKKFSVLHKYMVHACDRYILNEERDTLLYSFFIVQLEHMNNNAHSAYKTKSLEDHVHNTCSFLNAMQIFKTIKNKNFKIVSVDKLEEQMRKLMPKYFTN